jgi:hypothetical protein
MRRLLLDSVLFAAAVLILTSPAWGQGKPARSYDYSWRASDYGGCTLYEGDKVIGVLVGKTFFAHDTYDNSWFQMEIPAKAPPVPKHLKPDVPKVKPSKQYPDDGFQGPYTEPVKEAAATVTIQSESAPVARRQPVRTVAEAVVSVGQWVVAKITHPLNGRLRGRRGCG